VLQAQGKLNEAMEAYREDLAITMRLHDSDASNEQWQRDVAVRVDNIGDVLLALAKPKEARLANSDLSNATWQRDSVKTAD
jgi:hypothetical protein